MKAYIHVINGIPWNEECAAALRGFSAFGIETVPFSSTDELVARSREDVVVGGTLILAHALGEYHALPENYSYPPELSTYYGRKIWRTQLKYMHKASYPLFIKPVQDKAAHGMVFSSFQELVNSEYASLSPDTEILCSTVVSFVSEWRCFVLYGEIIGIRCYLGDHRIWPDDAVIFEAVSDFFHSPVAYALDFGVTADGRTLLVEKNDAVALGCYGLGDDLYARLLSARWAELTGTADVLKNENRRERNESIY